MNAQQKAEILKAAGYFYTTSNYATTKHRWYQGEGQALSASPWISGRETFAAATNEAYGLFLESQANAPQTADPAAEAAPEAQIPAPLAELDALRQQVESLQAQLETARLRIARQSETIEDNQTRIYQLESELEASAAAIEEEYQSLQRLG